MIIDLCVNAVFGYIGSVWFFNYSYEFVMWFLIVALIVYAKLCFTVKSKKDIDLLAFVQAFIGCLGSLSMFYGYIGIPCCILFMFVIMKESKQRAIYYYIRRQYGHYGNLEGLSPLDDILDYDELISKTPFDKDKMSDFYASNKPMIYGACMGVAIFILSIYMIEGYKFFPIGMGDYIGM